MMHDLRRHLRFILAFVLGLLAGFLSWRMQSIDRLLIFSNVFYLSYLVLAGHMVSHMSLNGLRRHADDDDEGLRLIVPLAVGSVGISLVAIVLALQDPGGGVWLRPYMALVSVPLGWAMVHTVMAFHYAGLWYAPTATSTEARGLDFPGDDAGGLAGIWDFIYFSFTLGMTAQTSDIAITTTRLRRITVLHSALSFFYNTVLVALTVNVAVTLGQ